MADHTLVRESFDFTGGAVDESGPFPVIKGVRICGTESKWGYSYAGDCWTDEAIRAYEGISSYANHDKAGENRDVADKVGWFRNVRRGPDGHPEGDYCLVPTHPLTPRVVFAAKHNPKLFAMSHRAHVKWGERDGKRAVVGIAKPISVDVCCDGATTGGLYESAPPDGGRTVTTKATAMKVKDYANKLAPKCDVHQLLKLKTLVRESYGDADMPASAPAPDAADTQGQSGVDAAFEAAILDQIKTCMKSAGDAGKVKDCLKTIKKLLVSHGDIKAGPDDTDDEPAKKEEPKPEPAKEAAPADHSAAIADEIVRESFAPTATQLKALRGMPQPADRVAFIREQKGLSKATNPASASRESVSLVTEGAPTPESEVEQARKRAAERARVNQGLKPSKN